MNIFSDTTRALAATAPGEVVRLEMEAREIKPQRLARHLELDDRQLETLLRGDAPLTPEVAAKLEAIFDIEAAFWIRLEQSYQRHPKHPRRGGTRVGAGRKRSGIVSKQVRISASSDDLERIETWLKAQPSAAQSLAKLILEELAKPAKRSKR
jgi:addiction module HigA family antidote